MMCIMRSFVGSFDQSKNWKKWANVCEWWRKYWNAHRTILLPYAVQLSANGTISQHKLQFWFDFYYLRRAFVKANENEQQCCSATAMVDAAEANINKNTIIQVICSEYFLLFYFIFFRHHHHRRSSFRLCALESYLQRIKGNERDDFVRSCCSYLGLVRCALCLVSEWSEYDECLNALGRSRTQKN